MDKRKKQLGMNPSTAAHRLRMDILFKFISEAGHICYRCEKELTRETFSIEHKDPWLDSGDPLNLFFDLDNIAFSHLSCNSSAHRKPNRKYNSLDEAKEGANTLQRERRAKIPVEIKQQHRRARYLRTGN